MSSSASGPSQGTRTKAATIIGSPIAPRTRCRGTLLLAKKVSGSLTPGCSTRSATRMGPGPWALLREQAQRERRSASTQAAPAAAVVTPSTEGQVPIFVASGWETPMAVQ